MKRVVGTVIAACPAQCDPDGSVISYEYFGSFAVALGEGPVPAVRRIWADGKLIADLAGKADV